jgi:hypothetical protein
MPLNGGVPTTAVGDGSMKIPKPSNAAKSMSAFARVSLRAWLFAHVRIPPRREARRSQFPQFPSHSVLRRASAKRGARFGPEESES